VSLARSSGYALGCARYNICLPKSKCTCDNDRRESNTRFVKKLGISAIFFSIVVFFWPCRVEKNMLTSPHACIGCVLAPARTTSSGIAGFFHINPVGLLHIWISISRLRTYECSKG